MEPKGSITYSQEPATDPYSEPDESRPHFQSYFSKIRYDIVLPATPRSPKWTLPSRFPIQCFVLSLQIRGELRQARKLGTMYAPKMWTII